VAGRARRPTRRAAADGASGQGAARNVALASCDTPLIAFADADDICLPDRFAKQAAHLAAHQEIGALGTHVAYLGSEGRQGFVPPLALHHDAIRADLLAGRHAVVNSTLMIRREVLARVGNYRIGGAGEDWDLFLRLTEATRVANMPDVLYLYRLHGSSTNVRKAAEMRVRYAHACATARARENGLPEPDFEAFSAEQARRPLLERVEEVLDARSSLLYRRGITDVLHGRKLGGYGRLALAAAVSPRRLAGRLRRALRPRAAPAGRPQRPA
jgi:glycosyltransferase involved in cell wall biosynthesis